MKIKTIDDRLLSVQIPPNASILTLKTEIEHQIEIPPERQRILYQGRHLRDCELLVTHKVENDSILHLVTYLPQQTPVPSQPQRTVDEIVRQSISNHQLLSSLRRRRFPRRRDIAISERYESIRQNLQTVRGLGVISSNSGTLNFRRQLQVKQWVDVIDTVEQWLEAQVIAKRTTPQGEEVHIHYNGWPEHWDEWINIFSPRIQPLRTHTLQSIRSPMASPYPVVRPDSVILEQQGQDYDFQSYLQSSCEVMDSVRTMVENYMDVSARQQADSTQDELDSLQRQVIPLLDRTGRLMVDLSRVLHRTSRSEQQFIGPMPS